MNKADELTNTPDAPTMDGMAMLSDDEIRDDILARLAGASISLDQLGKRMVPTLSKGRLSQLLVKTSKEKLPYDFRERVLRAMRSIVAERASYAGYELKTDD